MPTSFQFLPWVRRGLTVALSNLDDLSALPAHATANVGVKLAGPFAGEAVPPISMQLYGPGDVVGIDTSLVVRTDPRPGATNFEPNFLAIVDFDPPDFPWMLTPARANLDDRLRPWLVLVVLRVATCGLPKMKGAAPLPQIRIAAADIAAELPPLGESWSWAHAQVISAVASADVPGIEADLQKDPRSNISRLICPRRLEPRTDYVACVVPAFEPGRLRGLGQAGDGSGAAMQSLAPAWNHAAAVDVTLPVYHHWEFSTSDAGDFESLARRLRTPSAWASDPKVKEQLHKVGTAPMSLDKLIAPGGELTTMEGALVPLSYQPGEAAPDIHADSLRAIVNTPAEQVDNPVKDEADGTVRRIEVKPPLWGSWHAKKHSVELADRPGHWLAGLNLNPRYRGAAGHGAEVVRKNQEAYVDACWDQVGTIRDLEMKFNLTRLAIEAQRALKAKHYDVLPPERLMQVMGPALSRIEAVNALGQVAFKVNGQTASLGGQVDRSSLPAAMLDGAMRRSTSPLRRGLRGAALRAGTVDALPALGRSYLTQMATASTKGAAFSVNAYVPDGILGTSFFDGLQFDPAGQASVDLSDRGLRGTVSVAQVQGVMAAASAAAKGFARTGLADLGIRTGQHGGVFTDMHVARFAALAAQTSTLTPADFGRVALQVEAASKRGVEGFLVEAQSTGGQLQISAMQLDKRSGALRLDRPLARFTPQGKVQRPKAGDVARVAGIALGNVNLADVHQFDNVSLFSNLPPNAFDLQAGNVVSGFKLSGGLEFNRVGESPPGRGVTSITLPPALRKRDVLKSYSKATKQVQQLWRDPFHGMRVAVQTVDFSLAAAAQIVSARTRPDLTLAARLASQVSVAGAAPGAQNAFVARYLTANASRLRFMVPALFDHVMAWPHLRAPMYKDLAELNQEAFMPGVGNLPPDLIMAVQVNQYFIDSFMVGANVEMNRELLWRGFPTDLRGTPFQRFWGRVKTTGTRVDKLDDMEPIHEWGVQPLGERVDINLKDSNRIALLVKGQLLRRYPNTAVYAWRRVKGVPPEATKLLKNAQGLPPTEADIQTPVFTGTIAPDVTFFGFDIDREAIDDWCFVVEEHMTEPRFGFDVEEPPLVAAGTAVIGAQRRGAMRVALQQYEAYAKNPGGAAVSAEFKAIGDRGYNPYKALSWSHVGVAAGAYASVLAIATVPNAPFASFPTLSPTPTASEIAKALIQQPFRAYWEGPDLKT